MSDEYLDPWLHPSAVREDDDDLDRDEVEAMFRLADGASQQLTNIATLVRELGDAIAGLPGVWAIEATLPKLLRDSQGTEFEPETVRRVGAMLSHIEGVLSQPCLRGKRGERARTILANARNELDWMEAALRLLNG
jgi:hypothetical protein